MRHQKESNASNLRKGYKMAGKGIAIGRKAIRKRGIERTEAAKRQQNRQYEAAEAAKRQQNRQN